MQAPQPVQEHRFCQECVFLAQKGLHVCGGCAASKGGGVDGDGNDGEGGVGEGGGAQPHSASALLFDSQRTNLLLQRKVPRQPLFTHILCPSHPKVLPSLQSAELCCYLRETEHCGVEDGGVDGGDGSDGGSMEGGGVDG